MFALRRAAARVIALPSKQLSAIRPVTYARVQYQGAKPILLRSLHQSWIRSADESRISAETADPSPAEAEIKGEIDGVEPSQEEQEKEIEEVSVAGAQSPTNAQDFGQTESSRGAYGDQNLAKSREPSTKIVYVGNLFFETTASQLEAEFSRYGTVVNARVVQDVSGRSKGFGFLEFEDQQQAQEAIANGDQRLFQGRRLSVQHHIPRERPSRERRDNNRTYESNAPSKTLFIGNMSYQMSDTDLNELFKDIRNVKDVRVAIDRRSGQPRGFAHADFVDIESAARAKEVLANKTVYGRQLRIDFSKNQENQASESRPERL